MKYFTKKRYSLLSYRNEKEYQAHHKIGQKKWAEANNSYSKRLELIKGRFTKNIIRLQKFDLHESIIRKYSTDHAGNIEFLIELQGFPDTKNKVWIEQGKVNLKFLGCNKWRGLKTLEGIECEYEEFDINKNGKFILRVLALEGDFSFQFDDVIIKHYPFDYKKKIKEILNESYGMLSDIPQHFNLSELSRLEIAGIFWYIERISMSFLSAIFWVLTSRGISHSWYTPERWWDKLEYLKNARKMKIISRKTEKRLPCFFMFPPGNFLQRNEEFLYKELTFYLREINQIFNLFKNDILKAKL